MNAMWCTVTLAWCWIRVCTAQSEAPGGDVPALTEPQEPEATAATDLPMRQRVEVVPVGGWTQYFRGNVTVLPTEALTLFRIPPPPGYSSMPARFNITFIIPDPPEGCLPNTTLRYSPAVYYRELCMRRDWAGKCTSPSKDGFRDENDLIGNYEVFKKVYFEYDFYTPKPWEYRVRTAEELRRRTLIKKTLKGLFCYDDREYWLAFSTTCDVETFIDVRVGIKDEDFLAKWTCRGFDHFMLAQHGSDAFFTSKVFWCIIIPLGYFALLFLLIFGCCSAFQCGPVGKATALLHFSLSFNIDDSDDDESGAEAKKPSRRRRKR